MKMSTNQISNQKLTKSKAITANNTKSLKNNQNVNNSSTQLKQSITFLSNYSDEDLEENTNSSNKMKTKLLSMWNSTLNNMKYGWTIKIRPTFNLANQPIWLLGICYLRADKKQLYLSRQVILNEKTKQNLEVISLNEHSIKSSLVDSQSNSSSSTHSSSSANSSELDLYTNNPNVICSSTNQEVLEHFKHDFYSRIWMTYRRDFRKIPGSNFTTDSGWGCMLRSGQMLLAQAFLSHFLQRNWRFTGAKSDKEDMIHRMLIKWFADDNNSTQSPFSVHQLVKCGVSLGKKPGDWYGPASVAYIMK